MYKKNKITKSIQLQLLTAALLMPLPFMAVQAQETAQETAEEKTQKTNEAKTEDAVEVISVTGTLNSLREAAAAKRYANQILDAISAEDIGQLPDNNMAEALQRITGVQIGRDDTGAGSGFAVRGLSDNRVEINGQTMAGSGESRSNDLSSLDSALFSGVEVIKSPTADMIEGALGATVRLKTRKPLDMKDNMLNLDVRGTKDSMADDYGHKVSILGATKFDLNDYGQFGVIVNLSTNNTINSSHNFGSNWGLASQSQIDGKSIFQDDAQRSFNLYSPLNLGLKQSYFDTQKDSANLELQWQVNDSLDFSFSSTASKKVEDRTSRGMRIVFDKNPILSHNQRESAYNDAPVFLPVFSRAPTGSEYERTCQDLNDDGNTAASCFTQVPAGGSIDRYILQAGTFDAAKDQSKLDFKTGEIEQDVITNTLGFNYFITDDLSMEMAWSTSTSKTKTDEVALNYYSNLSNTDIEDEDGENLEKLANETFTHVNFATGSTLPDFSLYALEDGLSAEDNESRVADAFMASQLYSLNTMSPSYNESENKVESLNVDFDWSLDNDIFTSIEFGARLGKNATNRAEWKTQVTPSFVRHAITSWRWRETDQDFSTQANPLYSGSNQDRPNFDWVDTVMAENGGPENYISQHLTTTEPFFPNSTTNVNVPNWVTFDMNHKELGQMVTDLFPGREGNCIEGLDACYTNSAPRLVDPNNPNNTEELAITYTLPSGELNHFNERYAYLIEEETTAFYLKTNFENVVFELPYTGNIGVRYVKTQTTSLGAQSQVFYDGEVAKDEAGETIYEINPIEIKNSYTNILPSANINFALQDNMFLRFAASKTMSRANQRKMSPSQFVSPTASSARIGNPYLEAQTAWNYDSSWEWYIDDVNMVSVAVYRKELSNFLEDSTYTIPGDGTKENPVIVITQPVNGGDGTINGIEIGGNHTFSYLPGFLNGFGVSANYTYTDSSQSSGLSDLDGSKLPVPNLSSNSFNFVLFYDKAGFNFRAAYNYRDESYAGPATASDDLIYFEPKENANFNEAYYSPVGVYLPTWNDEFATLDLSMSYKYKQTRIFLQATNVLDEVSRKYVGDKETTHMLTSSYNDSGASYVLGFSQQF
ncbi:TonB-dependent receptor [Colwellia piezophila]|uniref:TonB-dependent receptor n=1 Tax=Colwellia piezophila TaxID=211668 RepID=UPI00036BA673|nr:TonB-dependent receptor [Colwellia piezophila]